MFTQHKMLAYRNGKSAGRTADTNWHGPHRFTGSYHVVPVKRACVLHFESCTYEQVVQPPLCVCRMGSGGTHKAAFVFSRKRH